MGLCRLADGTPLVALGLAALVFAVGPGVVATAGADPPEVSAPITVVVDIRPGLCPNHLRLESPLTIPVAILAAVDFEIGNVEPGTVRLSRDDTTRVVEPIGWTYKDVGIPLIGGRCACHELRGDGLDDIEFYFSIKDVVATLGLEEHGGETVPLTLSGQLMTGEAIEGIDCAVVIGGPWGADESGDEIGLLAQVDQGPSLEEFNFAYYTAVSDRVTFAIYDVRGRVVAKLIDMDMAPGIYHATWNLTSPDSLKVPAGTYFARVSNGWASAIRKITVQ
jgi:hypothetical protein